jgi:RNA polymerase sigma-70 factor, ECF subfamily
MAHRHDLVRRSAPTGADNGLFATDPDAFALFYCEHVEAVQRFVARRVADRDIAADLTADVFVAAIESAGSYRPGRGAAVAWLFGVARNVVSAHCRRQGRERRAGRRLLGHRLLDADDITRMDDRLAAEAQSRRLYRAMDGLPDGERAVLELVALDDLSLAQAALALGIGSVAARARLHRARRRLADQLAGAPDGDTARFLHPKEAPS